jgi:signal transduction histidine kinase/CheY-like chemotaxis protein
MLLALRSRLRTARQGQGDLRDLRADLLNPVLAGTLALAVVVTLVPDPLLRGGTEWTDPIAVWVVAGFLAASALRRRSFELAVASLLGGLLAAAFTGLGRFPLALISPWFALLVVLAGTLLGKRGAVLTAAAVSAGFWSAPAALAVLDEHTRLGLTILTWGAFGLTWLMTQPLRTTLEWSWISYEHALAKTKEVEEHRGDLARALKELGAANYRLEVANAELERARAAAAAARDLKARFAAFVSHELRLPLNIVLGFSEMMVTSERSYGGERLPPAYRADVEAIYRAAHHLAALVDDVLDLSELDAHQMGLEKEWTSIAEVVGEAVETTAGLFVGKGLAVSAEVAADLPPVHADRTRVRQVIVNLLKNAARFTDQGGVRVTARREGSDLVVGVSDSGIGIPAASLPHVFDEFRQLESAGQRRWGGSGLGLTISKRFAEMHGGNLWVESEMGRGSTFFLSLPLSSNVVALPSRETWETWVRAAPAAEVDRPRVALLAPDRRLGRLIRRHLEGALPLDAADADDDVRRLAEVGLEGLVVAGPPSGPLGQEIDRLCADHPGLPVVVCRTLSGPGAALPGVVDYLVKPVDRARLEASLGRLGRLDPVLVVDDDPEMARLLAAMVRSIFPDSLVSEACSGRAALDAIERERPRLVLLDLVMPEMDGHEVLRRLPANGPAVVVVSAGSPDGQLVRAEIVAVTRAGGLSASELINCLNGVLAALAPAAAGGLRSPPAARAG